MPLAIYRFKEPPQHLVGKLAHVSGPMVRDGTAVVKILSVANCHFTAEYEDGSKQWLTWETIHCLEDKFPEHV